jgi:hypothetical protein
MYLEDQQQRGERKYNFRTFYLFICYNFYIVVMYFCMFVTKKMFYFYSHILFFLQIYIFKSCLYIFRWIYEVYFLSVITPKFFHFYFYYEFVNVMFYIGFNHLLYFICSIVEKLWKRWIITKMVARLINDILFLEWTKLILLG